jgi:hypothetical protein
MWQGILPIFKNIQICEGQDSTINFYFPTIAGDEKILRRNIRKIYRLLSNLEMGTRDSLAIY